jgi:hypothetical protein
MQLTKRPDWAYLIGLATSLILSALLHLTWWEAGILAVLSFVILTLLRGVWSR